MSMSHNAHLCYFALFIVQDSEEIVKIFFLGSPWIYFECTKALMIVISFYMALWLTNFCSAAESQGRGWQFLSFLPGALSAMVYGYIITNASMLKVNFDCLTAWLAGVLVY